MKKALKKEIRWLMFKIDPLRINYSIKRFTNKMYMYHILKDYKISEDFIREFMSRVGGPEWNMLSSSQDLSEDFIREFQDKLEWMGISLCQNLSESFIFEFKEKILWNYASEGQVLSEDFLLEHRDKLNYYCLVKNKKIKVSKEFREIIDRVKCEEWTYIGRDNCKVVRDRLGEYEQEKREINKYTRFEMMDL